MKGRAENHTVRGCQEEGTPKEAFPATYGKGTGRKSGATPFASRYAMRVGIAGFLVLLAVAAAALVFQKRVWSASEPVNPGGRMAACSDAQAASLADVDCAGQIPVSEWWEWVESTDTRKGDLVAQVLPDIGRPEPEAADLLRLLRDLPAQPPVVAQISSPYGWRLDPFSGREEKTQFHRGIDFQVPVGTPVVAPAPGDVVAIRRGGGYGRYVTIQHDSGFATRMAHLERVFVKVGDAVRRGDVIATTGGGGPSEGRSTGPHLHLEIRRVQKGRTVGDSVDPARLYTLYWDAWDALQAFPRARIHASYPPYVLSNIRTGDEPNGTYPFIDDKDRGEGWPDEVRELGWRHTPSASR
jgi:hypothetical protein